MGGGRAAGRVFVGNFWGGGAKHFFSGPKFPPRQPKDKVFGTIFLGHQGPRHREIPDKNLMLGQKSCRTKVSRIFRIFVPNFAPDFAPNFPRIFRGLFVLRFTGDGDQKKFTQNPRHFSMQNSQPNTKKLFTKFFWRAGKVTLCKWPFSVVFDGVAGMSGTARI